MSNTVNTGATIDQLESLPNEWSASEKSTFIASSFIPIRGTISGTESTRKITGADLGGGEDNVIESISLNNTALTPSSKNVNIPLATVSSDGAMSATDKEILSSLRYVYYNGFVEATGVRRLMWNGTGLKVSPDSSGNVLLAGNAGTLTPSGGTTIGNGTYLVTAEIMFQPTGICKTGEASPNTYVPMACNISLKWGNTDLTADNHMNTTFDIGHSGNRSGRPESFQSYWIHRIVTCNDTSDPTATHALDISIKCENPNDPNTQDIDFTEVGEFRWNYMIIEKSLYAAYFEPPTT